MGIDLAGTTLTSSSGLAATFSSSQVMKMGNTGILQRYNPGQPMFRAGGSGTAAAVSIGAINTWVPVIYNATNVNVGSCYNTSNGRFTVPVAGVYLVSASTYCSGPTLGWHIHTMFWVNGSPTVRRPSAGGLHRLHAYGNTGGYSCDTEGFEIIALLAGDYVNFYNYSGSYACTYIPQYSRFEGYLLG
jgi:hypothetical protein